MILRFFYPFIALVALLSCSHNQTPEKVMLRERVDFGNDWLFQKGTDTIPNQWESIRLPHTAHVEPLVVNNQWQGVSWYKKDFKVNPDKIQKKHFVYFEGIMQEARVWVNGKELVQHKGGYLPFTIDLTEELEVKGNNQIVVRVMNTDNSAIPPGKPLKDLDFNYYGGIYRNAFLFTTNDVYITDGVHAGIPNGGGIGVKFDNVKELSAEGYVKTHVQNDSHQEKKITVALTFSHEGKKIQEIASKEIVIGANTAKHIEQSISIDTPALWSPEHPNMYEIQATIYADGKPIDTKLLKTGIRSIALTEQGFFLNGKKRFINGTNRHQEYPYIGNALSDNAQYRDAYKIKQAGFDFVRLSHYPHAEAFMDACDELGLMVMNCIPGWQYYEEGEFAENSFQDIRDMVRRDRNHPSVIFWENSLNESGMSERYIVEANNVLDEELPYKDTFSAGWMDHPAYDLFIPARQHAAAPYYWNDYEKEGRKILIAEYGDWEYYAQNAGFNQKEFKGLKDEERTSRQLRGHGEIRLLQQALNFQEAFNSNLKGKNTIGHANWLMFDYNRGYSDNLESSGISDIFRIPKFSYYFYQSQKPPYLDDFSHPMVYIANYWQKDSPINVKVFSNAEEVELYLNDKLVERKKAGTTKLSDSLAFPPFTFKMSNYEPGTLKAIAYIKGEKVAEHSVTTPKVPVEIQLASSADDVVFVYAQIVDENNTLVPNANNRVTFEVIGDNAEIIGPNDISAEAGIATVLLKLHTPHSTIRINAFTEGLPVTSLDL